MDQDRHPDVGRIAAHVVEASRLELNTEKPRVLAIGSQLVHGSVGLNAAEAVYSQVGVRVARIPSIVLSVMPHYESFHRVDIDPAWIMATLSDLEKIGALDSIEIVTSGYLAAPEQARAIGSWLRGIRASRSTQFILDPTLGDIEVGFITDPALAGAVLEHLAPVATGITPNLFELALLTGIEPKSFVGDDGAEGSTDAAAVHGRIVQAARSLLGDGTLEHAAVEGDGIVAPASRRTEWVAVTGVTYPNDEIGVMLVTRDEVVHHAHECVATDAKGLGDTFAAAMVVALLGASALAAAVRAATDAVLRRIQ